MSKFFWKIVVLAVVMWLVTLILPGFTLIPFADDTTGWILSFLIVAFIFAIINATVGTIIRIVAIPLYILTLGIISIFINALILWLTTLFGDQIGWGLSIDNYFWTGIFAAILISIGNVFVGLLFKPLGK